jgi:transposase-like protein
MSQKRKQYSGQYKFKVAMAAAKGDKTLSQLASETGVHPTQIGLWKKQLLEEGGSLFSRNGEQLQQSAEELQMQLYEQIGRLKMELESPSGYPKKKAAQFG